MTELNAAMQQFMAQSEIVITREREGKIKKNINIRPLVQELACVPESLANARVSLRMVITLSDSGSARPAEVVQALSAFLPGLTARRTHRDQLLSSR